MMKAARILETALYVRDVAEAIAFYRDIIGLEPVGKVSDRNAFFRCGDGILLLFKAEETLKPPAPDALSVPVHGTTGPGHVCFAATLDEINEWCKHFGKHAIVVESDFEWPNGARSIYIRDPSGNSLEFAEPKLWS